MSKKIVMKFGGTSVGNADAIRRAATLIQKYRAEGHRLTVVVSAMRGVTDTLITAATRAAAGDTNAPLEARQWLWEKHVEAAVSLLPEGGRGVLGEIEGELSNFANLASATSVLGEVTPRAMDFISSLGERFNAFLIAAYLNSVECPAKAVAADTIVVTDTTFGNANPYLAATGERCERVLAPLLESSVIPVVTGFMGATPAGIVTTLGRGGSDYTASILGNALNADEIWIWSDVDGVLTADPRIVPDARPIARLSYREAAELAHFGAKVIHPKTTRPAVEKDIPIRMLNTFNPDYEGTWIVRGGDEGASVKAVTAIPHMALITVEGRGMLGVPGVAARLFGAVAQLGVSVLMISQGSSEQSICIIVPGDDSEAVVNALQAAFHVELLQGNIDRVWQSDDVVIVALVGAALRGTPGIAGKLFTALGGNNINVLSIAQGSSEYNLSLVVQKEDANGAVQAIHAAFNLGERQVAVKRNGKAKRKTITASP